MSDSRPNPVLSPMPVDSEPSNADRPTPWLAIGWAILRVCLGTLPATFLAIYAGFGVFFGIALVISGELSGLLMSLWGAAGLFGTISLWAVTVGLSRSRFRAMIAAGLVAGLLAILPLAYWANVTLLPGLFTDWNGSNALDAWLMYVGSVSLPVIAIVDLALLRRRAHREATP